LFSIDFDFRPEEWKDYLSTSRRGTVYHTLEWRKVLESVFGYETRYSVCRNGRGDCVGVLPLAFVKSWITGNRVVSLPFSQYGGPLVTDRGALECIVEHLRGYLSHGFEYVRLGCRDTLGQSLVGESDLKSSDYYSRCFVPLGGRTVNDVWKSIKSSTRREVKQSARNGVVVEIGGSRTADLDCFRSLILRTCRRHGIPTYPPELPDAIINVLVPKGLARIFVARLRDETIATLVLLTMNREAVYAYNFSDERFFRFRPNNALLWEAIKWSLDMNLSSLDLGTSSPEDNELLSFKLSWGAFKDKLHEYYIGGSDKILSGPDRRSSRRYRLASFVWKRLPTFLASAIGPKLLSHFG